MQSTTAANAAASSRRKSPECDSLHQASVDAAGTAQ